MREFTKCGEVCGQPGNRATGQRAKTAAEPSRFHPISVVVSTGRCGGAAKRLSFRPAAAAAGRQKRFYHPHTAAAAPNDGRFARTPQWLAGKTAFFTPTRRRQAKTTVVLPEYCRRHVANASFRYSLGAHASGVLFSASRRKNRFHHIEGQWFGRDARTPHARRVRSPNHPTIPPPSLLPAGYIISPINNQLLTINS